MIGGSRALCRKLLHGLIECSKDRRLGPRNESGLPSLRDCCQTRSIIDTRPSGAAMYRDGGDSPVWLQPRV